MERWGKEKKSKIEFHFLKKGEKIGMKVNSKIKERWVFFIVQTT